MKLRMVLQHLRRYRFTWTSAQPASWLTSHRLSAKLASQVLLQPEFWRGSLGLPPSLLCCGAGSLCPCQRPLPSASVSPLLCRVSPSAVSSLLNSPLPLLPHLWGQEQVRVTRRRFAWQLWKCKADLFTRLMVELGPSHKVHVHTHALLLASAAC